MITAFLTSHLLFFPAPIDREPLGRDIALTQWGQAYIGVAHNDKAGADYAIAKAIEKKFSAEDMENYFDPKQAPTEYDIIDGSITHMLNPKNWDWIKSADVKDTIISYVRAIDTIRREYLESEKKAI